MRPFDYHHKSDDEIEEIDSKFSKENGDDEHGIIPDAEYDLLFDHLGLVLAKHGTYSGDSGYDVDFSGCRYVDQIPSISIVPGDHVDPRVSLAAGLEAVSSSHRPFAVRFDYHPHYLLVIPPDQVFTTFDLNVLQDG